MTAFTTTSAFMNMLHGERSRGRTASPSTGGCCSCASCRGRQQGEGCDRRKRRRSPKRNEMRLDVFDAAMTCQYFSLANNRALAPGSST